MIKENSTVFCLGSPEGKRAFFRKCVSEENVYADNDEVFACITEDDKSYFIVCAPPCENLTAEEYFRSNRALISPADFDFPRCARLSSKHADLFCSVKPG